MIRELESPEKVAETIKADLKREFQDVQEPPKTSNGLKILLIVLIVLIGAPIILPVGFGLVVAALGIVIAAFSFFAGLVLGAVAIMGAGLVVIVVGIPLLVVALPAGLLSVGSGLLIFVVGLIGTAATVKLCMGMYPAMFQILVNICRWPFYHKAKTEV